jgi:hypothetical protein
MSLVNRLQGMKHPEVAALPPPKLQGVHESVAIVIKLLSLHLYLLSLILLSEILFLLNK